MQARKTAAQTENESTRALRIFTCGSVDDGKSTLVGRLLFEKNAVPDDQLRDIVEISAGRASPDEIDFSLLLDGLQAERDQGVTIDVAYRYFSTERRTFVIADAPGHEQYTRNMATAASQSDLALLLVDATKGLLPQTIRHAFIASLMGIRNVILAINKMDLVGFDVQKFNEIDAAFRRLPIAAAFERIDSTPISARFGDNVSERSMRVASPDGLSLVEQLERAKGPPAAMGSFRMPVQLMLRSQSGLRSYAGTIARGEIQVGDDLVVASSGRPLRVTGLRKYGEDAARAQCGDPVVLTFDAHNDIARGDVLASSKDRPQVADQFAAHIVWMGEEPLLPGRSYLLKAGVRTIPASITKINHLIDPETLVQNPAKSLQLNEIGFCSLSANELFAFDAFQACRDTGGFILIDRRTNDTVGAGVIEFPLQAALNIPLQALTVDKKARAKLMGQKPRVLWFTGLSGAGKSTIADLVEKELHAMGVHTILLDGDNVRRGMNKDLGFSESDRVENIRRVGEVAKLMLDAGLVVLCSFIAPFQSERQAIREKMEQGEFVEIFVETPIEICIERDPKGLYKKALAGEIANFTGLSQAYQKPEAPEIVVRGFGCDPGSSAKLIIDYLQRAAE